MESKNTRATEFLRDDMESAWVRDLAAALVAHGSSAEDLAHDSWLVLAASRRSVERGRAFLFGTAKRLARSRQKARRVRTEHEARASADADAPGEASALEALERAELLQVALVELSRLPKAQSRAVALRYVDGLRPEEIAKELGCQPATARAHVARGLATIRRRLDMRFGDRAVWAAPMALIGGPSSVPAVPGPWDASAASARLRKGHLARGSWAAGSAAIVVGSALLALWNKAQDPALLQPPSLLSGEASTAALLWGAGETQVAQELSPLGWAFPFGATASERQPTVLASPSEGEAAVDLERVLVTDRLTGEPLPFLSLRLASGSRFKGRSEQSEQSDMFNGVGTTLRTNGKGELLLVAELAADFLAIAVDHPMPLGPQLIRGTASAGNPIRVTVGPTVQFEVPPEFDGLDVSLSVRPRGGTNLDYVRIHLDDLSSPVRFRRPLSTGEFGPGPWEVEMSNHMEFLAGRALIGQAQGIVHAPVKVELERTGHVVIRLEESEEPISRHVLVELFDARGKRAALWPHSPGKRRPHVRMGIPVGDYSWVAHFGPGESEGTVTVTAGTPSAIVIPIPEPHQVDWTFHVECQADEEPSELPFTASVTSPDGMIFHVQPTLEKNGAGWTGSFKASPDAPAVLQIEPSVGWRARPSRLALVHGEPVPHISLEPVELRRVKVRLKPARRAGLRTEKLFLTGSGGTRGIRSKPSGFEFDVPVGEKWHASVACERCEVVELTDLDFASSSTVDVKLKVGWSGLVRVLDPWTGDPVPGIPLRADRKPIGASDPFGFVRFRKPFLPKRLTLDPSFAETFRIVSATGEAGVQHWTSGMRGFVYVERR